VSAGFNDIHPEEKYWRYENTQNGFRIKRKNQIHGPKTGKNHPAPRAFDLKRFG
jgi:hypothetical protein